MRMWMVEPVEILCGKHLGGCHVEIHMFMGAIEKGRNLDGFFRNGLLEPLSIKYYHDLLAEQLPGHKTPIEQEQFIEIVFKLPPEYVFAKVDRGASLRELLRRCPVCRENYKRLNQKPIRTKWKKL